MFSPPTTELLLEEQVASIHLQTWPQRLLVRDDSTDGTLTLIQRLEQRYGDWLRVLLPMETGCIGNINRLLAATTAPYVALADQDDVWLSHNRAFAKLLQGSGCSAPNSHCWCTVILS